MVWKLLRKNISAGQIAGYSLASLIGMSIVIAAVKFYSDVHSVFEDKDSFISKDYIIISKKISTAGTLGIGASTTFSDKEIDDIKSQPWVRDVGEFEAADFNVTASIDFGGRGMSTQLFFEAIPDRFFDVESDKWLFAEPSPGTSPEIPVIVSRDYLALYNFGYAAARGLPQINEALVSAVPLSFRLDGNGHHDVFRGRIVGFSSRLNTIAVPEDFMKWANSRYSASDASRPSRLIIEANTPGDPRIEQFMSSNSYEVAGDKADNGRASYFLTVVTSIIITVGAIITVLAFFILMLSIYLLLQKNRQKLHDLMLLGYSPFMVARPYYILICCINAGVLALSIVTMFVVSDYWVSRFTQIDMNSGSPVPAILTGLVITLIVSTLNCLAVSRIVKRNFFNS